MNRSPEEQRALERRRLFTLALFCAAVLLRLAAVFALREPNSPPDASACGADCVEFDGLARQLTLGHGYSGPNGKPTAFRAPGFPLLLAAVYATAGFRPWVAYLAFAMMGGAAVVLTLRVAQRLMAVTGAAAAGIMAALYLPHVYFASLFYSENLFALALAVLALASVVYLQNGSLAQAFLAGAAVGVSILTRPFAILLLPLLGGVFASCGPGSRRSRAAALALLVGAAVAVLAPWTLRNLSVLGSPIFGTTNGGSTFYGGNNDLVATRPELLGSWVPVVDLPGRAWVVAAPDEVTHDRREWTLGLRWVESNPQKLPRLLIAKLVRYWLPDVGSPNRKYVLLQLVATTPFLAVLLIGLFVTLREPRFWTGGWLVMHAITLATLACGLIFWGAPRFRDGSFTPLMLYGGVGVEWLLRRVGLEAEGRRQGAIL